MGVMGESVTAMRDPIFYRWHKFIDSLFQQYKATLQPYTNAEVIKLISCSFDIQAQSDTPTKLTFITAGYERYHFE